MGASDIIYLDELKQPGFPAGSVDSGEEIFVGDVFPSHMAGDPVALLDQPIDFAIIFRQPAEDVLREFAGDPLFDLVSSDLVDPEEFVDLGPGFIEVGIIGENDIGARLPSAGGLGESDATADVGDQADPAEGQGFQLGDSEGFVDGLSEFNVAATTDVQEFGIGRHSGTTGKRIKAKLIYQEYLYITGFRIEFLDTRVQGSFPSGKIRKSFTMCHRPFPPAFPV